MDRGEKINAFATLLLAIILGISQIYLAMQSYDLNNRVFQLQEDSLRADLSILVSPVTNQNWAYIANNETYFTVGGMLVNEGSRSTVITKVAVSIAYNYSNGEQYTDSISNYKA